MELLFLCLKVFGARILDVSLGTVRMIISVKGKKAYAAIIGFCEVFIWFIVVKDALNTSMNSLFIPLSYALGYATGTYVGGLLADKLVSGNLTLQVILSSASNEIVDSIRDKGYAVSVIDARGKDDAPKYMLFMEINKKKLGEVKHLIKSLDNKAFIVVNETKFVLNGYFK